MAGAVAACHHIFGISAQHRVRCSLLDFEPTWHRYTTTLHKIFQEQHAEVHVDFARCDVTDALEAETNRDAVSLVSGGHLHVFAYVCNETSVASQTSENVFYRDFVKSATCGAFMLFLDVEEYAAVVYDGIYEVGVHMLVLCSDSSGSGDAAVVS